MNFCKSLCVFLFFVLLSVGFVENNFAQGRERIVQNKAASNPESKPTNSPEVYIAQNLPRQIPILTNKITVQNQPLVKKTSSSLPVNLPANNYVAKRSYGAAFNSRLLQAIQTRLGIPYHYGSSGPRSYDCSGLVWSVFQEAGFYFERSSAKTLWQNSEAVEGDDKYIFGTLVFFNGLGHIGIVVDDKGFYHASSSKGVTYSTFDGYWGKRIVGFRRLTIAN